MTIVLEFFRHRNPYSVKYVQMKFKHILNIFDFSKLKLKRDFNINQLLLRVQCRCYIFVLYIADDYYIEFGMYYNCPGKIRWIII